MIVKVVFRYLWHMYGPTMSLYYHIMSIKVDASGSVFARHVKKKAMKRAALTPPLCANLEEDAHRQGGNRWA